MASLRAHLDQVMEMPDQSTSKLPRKPITTEPLPIIAEAPAQALPEPKHDAEAAAAPVVADKSSPDNAARKASRSTRATLTVAAEPADAVAAITNGGSERSAPEPSPESATGA